MHVHDECQWLTKHNAHPHYHISNLTMYATECHHVSQWNLEKKFDDKWKLKNIGGTNLRQHGTKCPHTNHIHSNGNEILCMKRKQDTILQQNILYRLTSWKNPNTTN